MPHDNKFDILLDAYAKAREDNSLPNELLDAALQVLKLNPGINQSDFVHIILRDHGTKVTDCCGRNLGSIFITLETLWQQAQKKNNSQAPS